MAEYNPRYFEDPYEFKPSRWYDHSSSSDDSITAFSVGITMIFSISLIHLPHIGLKSSRMHRAQICDDRGRVFAHIFTQGLASGTIAAERGGLGGLAKASSGCRDEDHLIQ